MEEAKIALVTGGNRGLGLETCRRLGQLNYKVILTGRNETKGKEAVSKLKAEGGLFEFIQLDVANAQSIEILYHAIEQRYGRLDVLVNNAGILLDKNTPITLKGEALFHLHRENLEKTLQTNLIGPYELCDRFSLLMQKHGYGRIVNISSGLGQLSEMETGYESYRISKTGINAVTRIFAARLKGTNILINSVCPGWVQTDMGGPEAPRSLKEGVDGIIWAATLPNGGPTGGFYRDGQPIAW